MGGTIQSLVGTSLASFNKLPAALKCPIFVMQEPMKTSSIFVFATSDNGLISSGSLGQARSGSFISSRLISITSAYSASSSASRSSGFSSQASIA